MSRGALITIEGLDGAGKTTLADRLADELRRHAVTVQLLREPGGVEVSERIRSLVKDPTLQLGPRAEALLYAAARAQLVEQALQPALMAGTWVLLDRFVDSSLTYQGVGRELGIEPVRAINAFATGGLVPDRTLLLMLDPAVSLARARGRDAQPDRLEREPTDFFNRISAGYEALATAEPTRIRMIDADQPPADVLVAAIAALSDLIPSGAAQSA